MMRKDVVATIFPVVHRSHALAGKGGRHPGFYTILPLMTDIDDLARRLEAVEQRNKRVESGKAWETSRFRVLLIALLTYIIAVAFLLTTELPSPFFNAFIPTIGYILSMQSLPFIKQKWIEKYSRRGQEER